MKNNLYIILVVIILGILAILLAGTIYPAPQNIGTIPEEETIYCTMDARICPDGSAVGRIPPACEFAPCPMEGNL